MTSEKIMLSGQLAAGPEFVQRLFLDNHLFPSLNGLDVTSLD